MSSMDSLDVMILPRLFEMDRMKIGFWRTGFRQRAGGWFPTWEKGVIRVGTVTRAGWVVGGVTRAEGALTHAKRAGKECHAKILGAHAKKKSGGPDSSRTSSATVRPHTSLVHP